MAEVNGRKVSTMVSTSDLSITSGKVRYDNRRVKDSDIGLGFTRLFKSRGKSWLFGK